MQESFLGNLGLGLTTMAIGLFVVFLGLAILIGMIYVMTTVTSRKKKEAEEKTAAPVSWSHEVRQFSFSYTNLLSLTRPHASRSRCSGRRGS